MIRRIVAGDHERIVMARNGRFEAILGPGTYWMLTVGSRLQVERHSVRNPEFVSAWSEHLISERRDVVKEWFTEVKTADGQVAVVYVDGKLHRVLGPAKRMLIWRGLYRYSIELYNTRMNPEVPNRLVPVLAQHDGESCATFAVVEKGSRGLLFIDGSLHRELHTGKYAFWKTVAINVEYRPKATPVHK